MTISTLKTCSFLRSSLGFVFFMCIINASLLGKLSTFENSIWISNRSAPENLKVSFGVLSNPEIDVKGGGNSIPNGNTGYQTSDNTEFGATSTCGGFIDRVFNIHNDGTAVLNLTGPIVFVGGNNTEFSIQGTVPATVAAGANVAITVRFTPTASGVRSTMIRIPNDDTNENPYEFNIRGTGQDPDINLQGNNATITHNDYNPGTSDSTDFGNVGVCDLPSPQTVSKVYTIQNTIAGSTLTITGIGKTGSGAADFTITQITFPHDLVGVSNKAFKVTFNPSVAGTRVCTLQVQTNACSENPYEFTIRGEGVEPEVNITGAGQPITDGSPTPSTTNDTDFGSADVTCSGLPTTVVKTFTIQNTGTSVLNLTLPVVISGTHAADFSVTSPPSAATINAGSSRTFQVTFDPSAAGTRTATVTVNNSDCNEAAYDFAIRGLGRQVEMDVRFGATSIADGSTDTTVAVRDIGSAKECDNLTSTKTFTIHNTSTAPNGRDLTIGAITDAGGNNGDFSYSAITPAGPIAPGGSASFTVTFNPGAVGIRRTTVSIVNDDCDENPYNFEIFGRGQDGNIVLRGGATGISDDDSSPSSSDSTNFGTLTCPGSNANTFTIRNTNANGPLTINSVTSSNTTDFSIAGISTPLVIPDEGTATFQVVFSPASNGTKTSVITINNDMCDNDLADFTFEVEGLLAQVEIDVRSGAISISDGDITPSTLDNTDYGTNPACGLAVDRVFTIRNDGNASMTISSCTVSPTSNFTIQSPPAGSVNAGSSTSFTLRYTPGGVVGTNNATVNIVTTDCDESTYDFSVTGSTGSESVNPVIACKLSYNAYLNSFGLVSGSDSLLKLTATDNCTSAGNLVFGTWGPFDCNNVSMAVLTNAQVTDGFGNSASCNVPVTVIDTVNPTMLCQNVTVYLNSAGSASVTAAQIDNGSNDACGIATRTLNTTSFTCANVGSNNVTLTVTDNNAQVSTCQRTVTVQDTITPIAICRPVTLTLDAGGAATLAPASVDNGSSDACGINTRVLSQTAFTCAHRGANTVTLTVTDVNANSRQCQASIFVQDITAPTAICQNITVALDSLGNYAIGPNDIDNGSSDNCAVDARVLNDTDFDCSDLGANSVLMVVGDIDGNADSCTSTVTVVDNRPPTALCRNITLGLDSTGVGTITPSQINNLSFDACGITTTLLDSTNFDCGESGNNPVVLTVRDGSNNQDTCHANVYIFDNSAPSAACTPDTVYLDVNGVGATSVAAINNGSGDACGGVSITLSQTNFNCTHVGPNNVTLTVTDSSSNYTTCQAVVTVLDTIKPVARCGDIVIVLNPQGTLTINPFFIDNGSTDGCGISTRSLNQTVFNCSHVNQSVTVVLTVTDPRGLSDTCHAEVITRDYTLPSATCNNLTLTLNSQGQASTTLSAIQGTVSDACGIASVSINDSTFTCADVGSNQVIMTVTDPAGNIRRCTSSVYVDENVNPTALCQGANVFLDSTGIVQILPATIDGGSTDNCGIVSSVVNPDTFTCSNVGVRSVTLTVEDAAGNQAICAASVNVQDNINPWITCHDTTITLATGGTFTLAVGDLRDSIGDNCGISLESLSQTTFDCSDFGVNTITITAVDVNGNSNTCTSLVTVQGAAFAINSGVLTNYCGYNVSCNGAADGSAFATSTGGCPPHTFLWSNTSTNDTVTGLAAGTYYVTITDGGGNSLIDTIEIVQPQPISIAINTVTQTCAGDSTASIDITPVGGNVCGQLYDYIWSTGDTTEDLTGLPAGVYQVTVSDSSSCQGIQMVTVTNFAAPNPTVTEVSGVLTCSPAFSTYQWSMGGNIIPGATSQSYTATATGSYSVAVTDANGCEGSSASVNVIIDGVEATLITEHGLVLFPNPATRKFSLRVEKPILNAFNVEITDVAGKVLTSRTLPNLQREIDFDITDFAAGTYLVTMRSNKFPPITMRLVVE